MKKQLIYKQIAATSEEPKKDTLSIPSHLKVVLYGLQKDKYNNQTVEIIKLLPNGRVQVKLTNSKQPLSVNPLNIWITPKAFDPKNCGDLRDVFALFLNTLYPQGKQVLELGCGIGISLKALQHTGFFDHKESKWTGIDIDEDSVSSVQTLLDINHWNNYCSAECGNANTKIDEHSKHVDIALWLHPHIGGFAVGVGDTNTPNLTPKYNMGMEFEDDQVGSKTKEKQITLLYNEGRYKEIKSILIKLLKKLSQKGTCLISVKSYPEQMIISYILNDLQKNGGTDFKNLTFKIDFISGPSLFRGVWNCSDQRSQFERDFYSCFTVKLNIKQD